MKAFSLPALFAVLTLSVAMWTMLYRPAIKPPNALSYKQPVMAFEFAQTDQDIQALFVDVTQHAAIDFIKKMRYLTQLDFLFILFYTLFTVSFAWKAGQIHPSNWTLLALIIAPIIGLCDVLENIQLLRILDAVQTNSKATYQPELHWLSIATWIKWETTGVVFLLISPFLWKGGYVSKGIAILSIVVFITGGIALIKRLSSSDSIVYAETFSNLVLLTFLLFALFTIFRRMIAKPVAWL